MLSPMTNDLTPADRPIVILNLDLIGFQRPDPDGNIEIDITPEVVEQLRELSAMVTLVLSCTGTLDKIRPALQRCAIFEVFGDILLASGIEDVPKILRQLGLSAAENRPFIVGRAQADQDPDYTYVPSLSLLYGALAGQDIVLASVRCPFGACDFELALLRRSSVVPVYRHHVYNDMFIVYLCEGSRSLLEAAGFEIVELGGADLVAQADLFLQYVSPRLYDPPTPVAHEYQVFSDDTVRLFAIPVNKVEAIHRSGGRDSELIHLSPDSSLFSKPASGANQ